MTSGSPWVFVKGDALECASAPCGTSVHLEVLGAGPVRHRSLDGARRHHGGPRRLPANVPLHLRKCSSVQPNRLGRVSKICVEGYPQPDRP